MYRTPELYELILQGIPASLRNELWLIFSGAVYEVCGFIAIGWRLSRGLVLETSQSPWLQPKCSSIVVDTDRW